MIAMASKRVPKSLEEYRQERYESLTEFIVFLGISAHTYYSARDPEKGVRPSTMRKIAERLGVHPRDISEFVPHPKE